MAAAVVGGTASELAGGKFANGAVTGAFSFAFNEVVHNDGFEKPDPLQKGESRKLTRGEIELARSVFGDSIDYSEVSVFLKKYYPLHPKSVAMAPNGNIYLHPKGSLYRDDFSQSNLKSLFIHEMTHVWQHQQDVNVVFRGIFNRKYDYTLEPGMNFSDFNIEQQGDIVSDYYRLRWDSAGGPLIELYRQVIPFSK